MTTRLFAYIAAFLCLAMSAPASAQEQNRVTEIRRLQTLLLVINSELKADLDQILVLQRAISGNAHVSLAAQGRSPDFVTVEDAVAAERRAVEREDSINARLDAILARSAMLDAQKQPQQHSHQEKSEGAVQIEQTDPFVVGGKDPGGDAGFAGIVPEVTFHMFSRTHESSD